MASLSTGLAHLANQCISEHCITAYYITLHCIASTYCLAPKIPLAALWRRLLWLFPTFWLEYWINKYKKLIFLVSVSSRFHGYTIRNQVLLGVTQVLGLREGSIFQYRLIFRKCFRAEGHFLIKNCPIFLPLCFIFLVVFWTVRNFSEHLCSSVCQFVRK